MIVITLEKCPISLRGDLTKWLQEISPGVYVGHVSARVRDRLWERVCETSKSGRATMVFSARNEQHLDFRVHNTLWEPIDYDGIKLMMRPSAARMQRLESKANARRNLRCGRRIRKANTREPRAYAVVDIETTGLDANHDSVIEIAAIRVIDSKIDSTFQTFIDDEIIIPKEITGLTGIKNADLREGLKPHEAIDRFLSFIGSMPLVMHNAVFDIDFIDILLDDNGYDEICNECIDTLVLSRNLLPNMRSHSLDDMCAFFGIDYETPHRALNDCRRTQRLFLELLSI